MTIVIALMVVCLAWFTAVKPWRENSARNARREMLRTMRRFQTVAVARYHPAFKDFPELQRLSLDEVARIFDVERAYHELRVTRPDPERFF
ncbi:MAG: hypothetical protein RL417_174 [Pseudomonadota bacterium]